MASDIINPAFSDEATAREWLEHELWPHGPVGPHCGAVDCHYKVAESAAALLAELWAADGAARIAHV